MIFSFFQTFESLWRVPLSFLPLSVNIFACITKYHYKREQKQLPFYLKNISIILLSYHKIEPSGICDTRTHTHTQNIPCSGTALFGCAKLQVGDWGMAVPATGDRNDLHSIVVVASWLVCWGQARSNGIAYIINTYKLVLHLLILKFNNYEFNKSDFQ